MTGSVSKLLFNPVMKVISENEILNKGLLAHNFHILHFSVELLLFFELVFDAPKRSAALATLDGRRFYKSFVHTFLI